MTAIENAPDRDDALDSTLVALTRACPLDDLVARLVFLVDWRSAITQGRQTTAVRWRIDGRGPRLATVEQAAREVRMRPVGLLRRIMPTPLDRLPGLTADDVASIAHVLVEAAPLNRLQLVRLVMSTHPIMTAGLDGDPPIADLVETAGRYQRLLAA